VKRYTVRFRRAYRYLAHPNDAWAGYVIASGIDAESPAEAVSMAILLRGMNQRPHCFVAEVQS
jgi:hypothetical protein